MINVPGDIGVHQDSNARFSIGDAINLDRHKELTALQRRCS